MLHPADPGTVPGTRIEHDERTFPDVGIAALRGNNAHEAIVRRSLERASVQNQLTLEVENIGMFLGRMLEMISAALA
jgi:hypothetical protein